MAKISIIMGAFNPDRDRLLASVQSIVRQSFGDWELLLYDDGSSPAGNAHIRTAAKEDGRIRYYRGERNRGLAFALNECIRRSTGKYIARMDDDDRCVPSRLQKQFRFLESHREYQWVGSLALLCDEQGVWGKLRVPERPQIRDFLPHSPFIHPTVLFRREALMGCGGYDASPEARLCEDYELFLRLYAGGLRGYNLQEPLLLYWENAASYQKRNFARRVREMRVRYRGFRALGIPGPTALPYVCKPLLAGAMPAPVYRALRRRMQQRVK